jgi:hypothetical protein
MSNLYTNGNILVCRGFGFKITLIDSKNPILLQARKTSIALSQKPNIALFLQPLLKNYP